MPDDTWLALNGGVPTPRPENIRPILPGGTNALAQSIYKSELKDYKMVLADLATARDAIILSLPEFIVKTLEDPELVIALVTEFQIVAAVYLELGTVHMNDLEEVRAQLDNPICDSFDVHLADFMERCVFLAANNDTVSPVEIIRTLTKSLANLSVLHAWALRFNELYPLPIMRTTANFIAHCRSGVRNLTTADAGYPRRIPGRGGGRGGRGGRGTPYVKVFVNQSFVPPAGTKYCWFHGYKGHNGADCRNAELTAAQKAAKTHSDVVGGCLQSTM